MTALDQIELKKDQIRYKKVGKKYIVDNDPWAYEGLREGYWLVKVSPGLITIRQQIYPEKSAITAAARDKEEQLLDIIRTASEAQLYRNSLTPEALAAKKYSEIDIGESEPTIYELCYIAQTRINELEALYEAEQSIYR